MPNIFRRLADAITNRQPEKRLTLQDDLTPSVKPLRTKFQPNIPTTRSSLTAAIVSNNRKVIVQDYDLAIIDRFADNESIVFQTFSKLEEKCTNNGWQFTCPNQEPVDYIRRRLQEFARVVKKPTDLFVRELLQDLIKYSNCFLYKFRDPDNSSGKRTKVGEDILEPIASYIRLDPTSVIPERDDNGNVIRYHVGIGQQAKKVLAQDILHIYAFKNGRNNLGTPYIWPVIDDIRVLRHMEENLEMLIHKHIFPIYQYIVGTDEFPPEPEEIEKITVDIENIPSEGGWVTPNRHKIEVIGAQGKSLDVSKYLNYFRERVVMGLGIGLVSFGLAAGASRSSSEVIDRNLVEKAKIYQRILSSFFNDLIITELLAEGGYDPWKDGFQTVTLDFNEIDSDTQIKIESHAINLFNNNLLDYDEARARIGEDIKGPNDLTKLNFSLFGAAKMQEYNKELAIIEGTQKAAGPDNKQVGAEKTFKSIVNPANQHGEKSSPRRQRDEIEDAKRPTLKGIKSSTNATQMKKTIGTHFDSAKQDIIDSVQAGNDGAWATDSSAEGVRYALGNAENAIYHASKDYIASAWDTGYVSGWGGGHYITDSNIRLRANEVLDSHASYVKKTMTDVQNDVIMTLAEKGLDKPEVINKISSLFDLKKHYINDAVNTSVAKAWNHGRANGFRALGHKTAVNTYNDSGCAKCKARHGEVIDLSSITVDSVAPHHLSCECQVDLPEAKNE